MGLRPDSLLSYGVVSKKRRHKDRGVIREFVVGGLVYDSISFNYCSGPNDPLAILGQGRVDHLALDSLTEL